MWHGNPTEAVALGVLDLNKMKKRSGHRVKL